MLISMVCSVFICWGGLLCVVVTELSNTLQIYHNGAWKFHVVIFLKLIVIPRVREQENVFKGLLSVEIIITLKSDAESKTGGVLNQVPGDTLEPDDRGAVTRADKEMSESN